MTSRNETFERALALGGARLDGQSSAAEALDDVGYAVLQHQLEDPELAELRAAFEDAASSLPSSGTRHVEIGSAPQIERLYADPHVLGLAYSALGRPYRVHQLSGRNPSPGYGQQGLHTDWVARNPGDAFGIVTVLWLLDEFTATNGATRLIPGSHRLLRPLPKSMRAPASTHPDEIRILAPAGSALVFNGHLWHSGTRNESKLPRRVVQVRFVIEAWIGPNDTGPPELEPQTPLGRLVVG